MARVLESEQNALLESAGLSIITLVRITTYTNRATKSGTYDFWLSDKPAKYDYANEGTDRSFWPVVATPQPLTRSMVHLPRPDDFSPFEGGMTLVVSNQEFFGRRLITILKEKNIINADVEVGEIAVPSLSYPQDLTAKTGTEHTVLFRGSVIRVGSVKNNTFEIECAVSLPSLAHFWGYANSNTVDDVDRGKRYPVVYGDAKKTPMISELTGAFTVLSESVTDSEVNIDKEVTDATRFPNSGNFDARWGAEEILCSKTSSTLLKIQTGGRARNGTTASAHEPGESIMEVIAQDGADERMFQWVPAGHPLFSFDDVYVISPVTNELMRVELDVALGINERQIIEGEAVSKNNSPMHGIASMFGLMEDGGGINPEMKDLLDLLISSGGITTQPVFKTVENIVRVAATSRVKADPAFDQNSATPKAAYSEATVDDTQTMIHLHFTSSEDEGVHMWVPSGSTPSTRDVKKFRFVLSCDYDEGDNQAYEFYVEANFEGTTNQTIVSVPNGSPSPATIFGAQIATPWSSEISEGTSQVNDVERSAAPSAWNDSNYASIYIFDTSSNAGGDVRINWAACFFEFELWPGALTRTTDASSAGGTAVGFPIRCFGDVGGWKAPGDSIDKTATVAVFDNMDASSANWDSDNLATFTHTDSATLSDDTSDFAEGTGSLKVTNLTTKSRVGIRKTVSSEDWTGKAIVFWMKIHPDFWNFWIQQNNDQGSIVNVYIESSAGNYKWWGLDLDRLRPGVWSEFHVSVDDNTISSGGTLDITNVSELHFLLTFDLGNGTTDPIWFDNIRIVDSERHYSVAHEALLEHPVDVLTHWIEYVGGERVDETTRLAAITNLGSNKLAGDVRPLGFTWFEVLQRLAYMARANVIPEETASGRVWKILTADTNYKFAAPSVVIDQFREVTDERRDLSELSTLFNYRYGYRAAIGANNEEGFTEVVVAGPVVSDVSVTAATIDTARKTIGDREAAPEFFRMINEEATAEDVAGYFVQESIAHDRAVYQISAVPWYQGYKVELGDIVSVTPEWMNFGGSQLFDFDTDAASWTPVQSGDAANESTIFRDGAGSMKIDADGGVTTVGVEQFNVPFFNVRDRAVKLWVYVPAADFANFVDFELYIGSGAFFTDYVGWTFPASKFTADTWVEVVGNLDGNYDFTNGTIDPTRCRTVRMVWNQSAATAAETVIVDDMRISNQSLSVRIIQIDKNHGSQHFDFTAVEVETV